MNEKIYWNYKELRNLSKQKGIPDSTVYLNTLEFKGRRARFFADKSNKAIDRWKKSRPNVNLNDPEIMQEIGEATFGAEAYAEAALWNLHTMADVLAQIMNVILLQARLSEEAVSFKKIKDEIKRIPQASTIFNLCENLWNSQEYKYIRDFVNTMKHRRLVKCSGLRVEYGENKKNDFGIVFERFTCGRNDHEEQWAKDIFIKQMSFVYEEIGKIGCAINDYLRK